MKQAKNIKHIVNYNSIFKFATYSQFLILIILSIVIKPNKVLSQVSPVDVSNPTTVVGNGTPATCTEAAFNDAIAKGGTITFNCGSAPYTLTLTSEKVITSNTVIDGGNLITLSGGNNVRILRINSYYDHSDPSLTVQNITFANGHTSDSPNTKSGDQGGAAIHKLGGTLTVINSKFFNNIGPVTGQDVAGGAIYAIGGGPTTISNSIFQGNQASNGGAIGILGGGLTLTDSQVSNNAATGNGGNPGNGGNGGAIYIDGVNSYFGVNLYMLRDTVSNNQGNAYGGGIFRIAYNGEQSKIDQCLFQGNSIPQQTPSMAGGVYLQGTNIILSNTTITGNKANFTGGLYVGPGSTLNRTNDNISGNTSYIDVVNDIFIDNNVNVQS